MHFYLQISDTSTEVVITNTASSDSVKSTETAPIVDQGPTATSKPTGTLLQTSTLADMEISLPTYAESLIESHVSFTPAGVETENVSEAPMKDSTVFSSIVAEVLNTNDTAVTEIPYVSTSLRVETNTGKSGVEMSQISEEVPANETKNSLTRKMSNGSVAANISSNEVTVTENLKEVEKFPETINTTISAHKSSERGNVILVEKDIDSIPNDTELKLKIPDDVTNRKPVTDLNLKVSDDVTNSNQVTDLNLKISDDVTDINKVDLSEGSSKFKRGARVSTDSAANQVLDHKPKETSVEKPFFLSEVQIDNLSNTTSEAVEQNVESGFTVIETDVTEEIDGNKSTGSHPREQFSINKNKTECKLYDESEKRTKLF